jgi:cytochrome c biogenesis protein CcmG/thiol:disulfide interchange protein DsbE
MPGRFLSIAMVACLLLLSIPARGQDSPSPAPNFSLKTNNGKAIELKGFAGKVVVVNFWATWCGPCRAEIPAMLQVYQKYKDKGLEIVGISLDDGGWTVVNPFVEKMKIVYPVVLGSQKVVSDFGGFDGIPMTFIVDKKGNIIARHLGMMTAAQFEKLVKTAL